MSLPAIHSVGGTSVFGNMAGINFADGTQQLTAFAPDSPPSSIGYVLTVDGPNSYGFHPPSGGGGAIVSVFGRTGSIVSLVGDYSAFYDPLGAAAAAQAASLALSRVKTIRVAMGTIASATPSSPVTSVTWPTPFADNNYTIEGTVVVAETPSDSAATAICCIGMIQLQPAGAGFNFVVCNADGVPHNVTAHFTAIHD